MAITFGTPTQYSGAASPRTIGVPAGIQDGDHWLILIAKDDQDTMTAPTDFETIYSQGSTVYDDSAQAAFVNHYPTAPSASVEVTGGDSEEWCAISVYVRGADATTFVSGAAQSGLTESQNATNPSVSGPQAGGAIGDVRVGTTSTRSDGGCTDMTEPSGFTLLALYEQGTGNGDSQIAAAYVDWVANGVASFSGANGLRDWVGNSFVIKAAAAVAGTSLPPFLFRTHLQPLLVR